MAGAVKPLVFKSDSSVVLFDSLFDVNVQCDGGFCVPFVLSGLVKTKSFSLVQYGTVANSNVLL